MNVYLYNSISMCIYSVISNIPSGKFYKYKKYNIFIKKNFDDKTIIWDR